ncbi:MAG TPA: rhodanese-like domain-containing protein [Candidatus Tumulicola sp.]|jgi:rhodanese-related sulfurtransferase
MQVHEVSATTEILDVRHHSGKHQIRGAVRYDPKALLDADPLVLPLTHDGPIAVYADSDDTVRAVVARLKSSGYGGATPLEGGIDAWQDAGLPLEEITQEQPVPGEPGAGMKRL